MEYLEETYKSRWAKWSVGTSNLRNHGATAVPIAISFLSDLPINELKSIKKVVDFEKWLDFETDRLAKFLPMIEKTGRENWGGARKSINIYLRFVSQCIFLSRYSKHLRPYLEVPLDQNIVKGLYDDWAELENCKRLNPQSFQVSTLDAESNKFHQDMASVIVDRKYRKFDPKFERVDLDAIYGVA